ncbi:MULTISPECIES: DsrE family protein [unclassified Paracoccus (in: a-proteobacteria)]|uniref:DsrE family protein n=1 Tax=unclassified Paracoccus (in: a-proteobacteria) TaxID=2688777 RepID=UPI0012B3F18F|nr:MULTISPECIES: DsrE family protein [unclassified Paracoccus (in: a-proteobacteria)]UXU73880.1 DsrE family protein [Paracoccus sp. SMMA_5]UXU79768.1 DsrE family protein [Paracoccus sp. SMMA_5_TC]
MKQLLPVLALSTALAGPALADEQRNLVTILTAPEPQTQLMAMVLTLNAVQQGAKAQILLCGPGGDIALRDAPASATAGQPPRDASPQSLMRMMMDQHDVKVEVCAIYLPGRGADASVLIDGVTPADPAAMSRSIIADDTVVMSF